MPKSYPKTYPKKAKQKKNKPKAQPRPASLLTRKSYWITLTLIMLVFTFAYGYITEISLAKEVLILSSILVMIGFAFYLGFKPLSYNKRVTAIFVGASVIGFCIWAAIVFSLTAAGINTQITSLVGADVFAVTSLIMCLIAGGLIGDLIGKNREAIVLFVGKFRK